MKKTLLFAAFAAATICANAQETNEVRTLTFEDKDYKGTGNVLGNSDWSSLIDNAEYNGDLLYGENSNIYMWYDEGNTELVWDGMGGNQYWSGGFAISNYYEADLAKIAADGGYTHQLSIPLETEDNNFGVINAYKNIGGDNTYAPVCAPLYFSDGEARTFKSVDVINTSYVLNSLTNGNSYAAAATKDTKFTVHFVGTHEDETTSEVTYLLADGRNFCDKWTTVDLSSMGAVKALNIYVTGSDDLCGEWGLNIPGNVAVDNISVVYSTNGIGAATAGNANATEIARYDINGNKLTAPARGLNIIRMSDGSVRKVIVK